MRRPLLLLLCVGCASTPDPRAVLGPDTPLIDAIEVKGVQRFSRSQLLAHTHVGETSWVPLTPDYHFNEALLAVDARRVEALYRAHGYYEARVARFEVRRDPEDPDEVRLLLEVVEGPATAVRSVAVDWAPGTTLDPAARAVLEGVATLTEAAPFEIPALNDSIGAMRLKLLVWGYPLARVRGGATVNEGARQAEVLFRVDPGPYARIGAVRVEGLRAVPEYMVQREVEFALGEGFSPATVAAVESSVRAMDVFRWVTVVPPREVKDGEVTLTLRVSEADPQSIKLGTRASFHSARWEQQLIARYTHTNLFGHLTRLDLDLIGGYAELPDPFATEEHGPVVTVAPTFTKKGLLEDQLVWTFAPRFDVDIEPGYQFLAPSERFGASRWFGHHIRADLSHSVRYVDFFSVAPELDPKDSVLGRDFRDPYLLSFAEAQLDLFWLDSVLTPTDGAALALSYALAGGPFQGDFDFQKVEAAWRGYWRPLGWLQLAMRLAGGLILPYGDNPSAPIDRRFYLGGADSMRGWATRRLSPRVEECEAPEDGGPESCSPIPIGGETLVQGNLEARFRLGSDFWLVAFADMGDVQAEALTWVPAEWNYAAGPGARYDSPVGLFRLDLGIRLNDPGIYDEPRWAVYFGLGETF